VVLDHDRAKDLKIGNPVAKYPRCAVVGDESNVPPDSHVIADTDKIRLDANLEVHGFDAATVPDADTGSSQILGNAIGRAFVLGQPATPPQALFLDQGC